MNEIKVLGVRFVNDGRRLRAFVDVQYGELLIRDFRIIQREKRLEVSVPMTTWRNPGNREIKFKPIITFPSDQRQLIEAAILDAYRRELENQNGKQF